jgi:hypothetical protein
MSRPECPLRFVCSNPVACNKTGIAFETVDGYPSGVIDTIAYEDGRKIVTQEGFMTSEKGWEIAYENDTANYWPLTVCDGSGAARQYGDLGNLTNPRDAAWLKRLGQAITGNTWVQTLKNAVDDFPKAPWVDIFQAEITRAETPRVWKRDAAVEIQETPHVSPVRRFIGQLGLIDRNKIIT